MYERYQGQVEFVCVYIQEAHPDDGWQVAMNLHHEIVYRQPTTAQERAEIAGACAIGMKLRMPMVIDELSNEVNAAYGALPERLYLIDAQGTIVWRTGPGPFGFDVDGWEAAIAEHVGVA